jgi:formate dehydrogenase major subunit
MAEHIKVTLEHHVNRRYHAIKHGAGRRPAVTYGNFNLRYRDPKLDGKLINLEGDSEHIINRGALCSKGAAMKAAHESDRRVKAPLYRAPGSDHWQQISWEDAYARITTKIKQTRDAYWIDKETDKTNDGAEVEYPVNLTDAIAFLGGAQNTNEECYLLAKMSRLLGSVWVEHQARL